MSKILHVFFVVVVVVCISRSLLAETTKQHIYSAEGKWNLFENVYLPVCIPGTIKQLAISNKKTLLVFDMFEFDSVFLQTFHICANHNMSF